MNCLKIQRNMLLLQSGELPDRKARALAQHVAACAACRAYRDDLDRLATASREAIPATERSLQPATMIAIRRAALRDTPPVKRVPFRLPYLRVYSYAAAVLLTLGGVLWVSSHWQAAGRNNRITAFASLITVATEEATENGIVSVATDNDQLHGLARQLLAIEGLNPDES